LGATTDPDGRYFILQVPPGEFIVSAHLVGYRPVRQEQVIVNIDRSIVVNFTLAESAIEVDAVTIVAKCPVVEQGVTSSQVFVTERDTRELPAATLLGALAFQPGISTDKMSISARGSSPDEVLFQIDGFESSNPPESRPYVAMNQAMIQEVQIPTGAFTAEYFSRAAVVNVVTREAASKPQLFANVRHIPVWQQHFGPGAYAANEFDKLVYLSLNPDDIHDRDYGIESEGRFYNMDPATGLGQTSVINSNKRVYYSSFSADTARFNWTPRLIRRGQWRLVTQGEVFIGWDSLTTEVNKKISSFGKSDRAIDNNRGWFSKKSLLDTYRWRHREHGYTDEGDYYIDLAVSSPVYFLKNTGIVVGYKNERSAMVYPAMEKFFRDRKYEATLKSSVLPGLRFDARVHYEEIKSAIPSLISGGHVGDGATKVFYQASSAIGETYLRSFGPVYGLGSYANKYYVDGNIPFTETVRGFGVKMTHTVSPSFYYTLSYEQSSGDMRTIHGEERSVTDSVHSYTITKAEILEAQVAGMEIPRLWQDAQASDGVKDTTITIWTNDAPYAWDRGPDIPSADMTKTYNMNGGGAITDFPEWSFSRVCLDAFNQINRHHGVKTGAEFVMEDLVKDFRRTRRSTGMN
jgi:hypothetical protein